MRKSAFCIGKYKGADQLCSNHTADLCLCFPFIDSKIPLNLKFQASSHLLWLYTAWFVSDLFGNPKDRFSHDAAQIMCLCAFFNDT